MAEAPPAAAIPAPGARLRLAYLDGLRALAASYVVLFHALPGFSAEALVGPWRLARRLFAFGHEAVAVFIVLSGYCLMLPVLQQDPRGLRVNMGRFVRRRALRILPPYFAALSASLLMLATIPALRRTSGTIWDDSLPGLELGSVLSHLLLVHNWSTTWSYQINGPLWSVASEWQIYFLFPLLLLPAWRRYGAAAALLAAAVVGYAPLLLAAPQANVAIPWYLLLFTFGMSAAAVGFSSAEFAERLRTQVRWGWLCAAVWLGCFGFGMGAARTWFSLKPLTDPLVGLATTTLLVYLTRSITLGRPSYLLRIFEARPLVELGQFSYSLYLTHLPVLALCYFLLSGLPLTPLVKALTLALVGSGASLVVARAFYSMVERPFLKLR